MTGVPQANEGSSPPNEGSLSNFVWLFRTQAIDLYGFSKDKRN